MGQSFLFLFKAEFSGGGGFVLFCFLVFGVFGFWGVLVWFSFFVLLGFF